MNRIKETIDDRNKQLIHNLQKFVRMKKLPIKDRLILAATFGFFVPYLVFRFWNKGLGGFINEAVLGNEDSVGGATLSLGMKGIQNPVNLIVLLGITLLVYQVYLAMRRRVKLPTRDFNMGDGMQVLFLILCSVTWFPTYVTAFTIVGVAIFLSIVALGFYIELQDEKAVSIQ